MAKRLRPEEMTEPPSDDTPSKRMSSVANVDFDDILKEIAKALHRNSDINDLGKALGFGPADINRKIDENAKQGGNYMGTWDLLRMWRSRQTHSTEKAALRSALLQAGFDNLADQYLSTPVPGDNEAMPSDMMKLREQLKRRYRKKFGQINTSPVDSESRTWLQYIYVSLVLILGLEGDKEEPIDYDGLFKFIETDTPKGFVTRLAFIGEAGVGKSTLFAKIALDWAEGKILQEINLLFLESFREIKESGFFGDTVMAHFPDDSEIEGERVDAYVRKNPRKVLILLDGLDEAHIDIKKPNSNDAIVSIVRGDRFIDTPVVITTRPFGADQIKSIMTINDHYTFGKVKGFTKKNMATYVKNYFKDDSQSASTLINFIDTNQVVSEYMAPFPIFCCMLCCLWKTPSGRENIQTMETFSQLLKRLVFSLQEQYSSKGNESEEDYESSMNKADESMKRLGCIAFQGLLDRQLIFDEKSFGLCEEAARTACEVGILSMEKRPAPLQIRESQRKQFIQEFSFPHKLLQEYIASFYLASLFHKDRQEFNTILANTLIKTYVEFRYVLYFTAAHGGEVGKSVLETLCKKVDKMEFIIWVAFECHDLEAIDPVRNLLKTKADLRLDHFPFPALIFTLESIGQEVVRRSSSIRETLGVSQYFEANASSSHVAAVGLFTLPNLRSLKFKSVRLDDEFYTGISAAASQSKIEELSHLFGDLGFAASSHYARSFCSMPHLRSLSLYFVNLSDEFYLTMASEASKSKIEKLDHCEADLGSAASSHYARCLCSLPHLRSLKLSYMKLSDEFYLTMASEASKAKIEELTYEVADLGSAASSHYARCLCSLPHLRSLKLTYVELSDEFYLTMASEASKAKIEELDHTSEGLGSAAPSHYARGLCFMPHLRSLKLDEVELSDEFYSTMASEASKSKIEVLTHSNADLGSPASSHYARGLCFMPHLQSLKMHNVKLSDEFYSTMATEASKSKIQTLSIRSVSMMTPRRLHAILSLPRLLSFTLRDIGRVDIDDGEKLTRQTSSVDELSVDGKHVISLWNLGLHTACPRVKKLELKYQKEENVSSEIATMACTPFHHLTHLHIQGERYFLPIMLNDHVSFCDAVKTSCPRLTKLSFTRLGLFNEKAAEIIQLMKIHPHLTSIELNECLTNFGMDPLVSKVNSEGKVTVTVIHAR